MNTTVIRVAMCPAEFHDAAGEPPDAFEPLAHRGRDGWYILDCRTRRVAVLNDRPQTGLPRDAAHAVAALLNESAALPAARRH